MLTKKEEIVKLYDDGITLQEIGNRFNISRQRVWQIIKKDYTKIKFSRISHGRKPRPRRSEIYVQKKLSKMYPKAKVELQNYNSHFDLLFNKKKVEIKYARVTREIQGRKYYSFTSVKSIDSDIFVYILLCGDLENPVSYIVPAQEIKNNIHIPLEPVFRTKMQRKYRESWKKYFGY